MFRKMRRYKQEISPLECKNILKTAKRAVLSVIDEDGYPYGIPINFYYDENENTVYLHGAKEGEKIDSLKKCDRVCFTVWDDGYKKEGDWAFYVSSVIARGRAELIGDIAITSEKVRKMGLKYYPDADEVEKEIKSAVDKVQLIAIHIENMTGKRIHEK